jgi:hypothetical protein
MGIHNNQGAKGEYDDEKQKKGDEDDNDKT